MRDAVNAVYTANIFILKTLTQTIGRGSRAYTSGNPHT